MKRILVTALLSMMLVGCSHQAQPNYFAGDYYLSGDDDCRSAELVVPGTILCKDADGYNTGLRKAMTQNDMQIYQINRMNQQMQMAQLNQQLQQTGQSIRNQGQQIMQQSQSYSAPQVQSYSYGSGITSYSQVGNSLVGSNGSSCQYVGSTIICR